MIGPAGEIGGGLDLVGIAWSSDEIKEEVVFVGEGRLDREGVVFGGEPEECIAEDKFPVVVAVYWVPRDVAKVEE